MDETKVQKPAYPPERYACSCGHASLVITVRALFWLATGWAMMWFSLGNLFQIWVRSW